MRLVDRRVSFVILSVSLAAMACARSMAPTGADLPEISPHAPASPAPVPPDYQPLYDSLSHQIGVWEGRLADLEAEPAGITTFGAELLPANGNRGEALLEPTTMTGVHLYLDRLQELGVGGVTVQIADPLLWPEYPKCDAYAGFFVEVAEAVRDRGLVLLIETGPAFTGTAFSSIEFDWSALTLQDYWAGRRAQLERIARDIRPDYLSFGSEPGTEAMLTGLTFSVDEYLDFVRGAAEAIDPGLGVRVGAGSGSWEDPAYARRLAGEPALDFIGVHIYPLSNGITDYLERASEAIAMAREAGKQVVLGETWLYKATPEELAGGLAYSAIFARDAYSFWQPLDIRFVETMAGLTRAWGVDYVSFFWSGFFFGYLEHEEGLASLPLPSHLRRLNQEQAANLRAGVFSETGRAYQRLLGADG
jgi:hypothetical protein